MPFTLSETKDPADIRPLSELLYDAFTTPDLPFFWMLCPKEEGPDRRTKEVDYIDEHWHKPSYPDPKTIWVKVVDSESGELAGAGMVQIRDKERPYEGHSHEAIWWPEGERREFVTQMIELLHNSRDAKMTRPHIYYETLVISPKYRRHGLGHMITKSLVQIADEKQMEIWVNASAMAKSLYPKHGFLIIDDFELMPKKENPGPEWHDMCSRFLPERQLGMWRPVGGWREGMTKPWETEQKT